VTIILAASTLEAHLALVHAGAPTDTIVVIRAARGEPTKDPDPFPGERKTTWRTTLFDDDDLITWEDAEWR